jgi:L-amino acid N-acyltransferase YncA
LAALIDDPKAVVEVWEEDGRLVGYVCVSFLELDAYPIVVADVEDIAVLPAYQRQGIGTEMLTYAEAEAQVRGAGVLRADIGVANAASKALHERQGFAVFRQSYEKRLES